MKEARLFARRRLCCFLRLVCGLLSRLACGHTRRWGCASRQGAPLTTMDMYIIPYPVSCLTFGITSLGKSKYHRFTRCSWKLWLVGHAYRCICFYVRCIKVFTEMSSHFYSYKVTKKFYVGNIFCHCRDSSDLSFDMFIWHYVFVGKLSTVDVLWYVSSSRKSLDHYGLFTPLFLNSLLRTVWRSMGSFFHLGLKYLELRWDSVLDRLK